MDLGLADARVLVVGGSRGMGRAAAETFAREGARVAVLARASQALDETVAHLRSAGSPESMALTADLTNLSEVDSAIDLLGSGGGPWRSSSTLPDRSKSESAPSTGSMTTSGEPPSTSEC